MRAKVLNPDQSGSRRLNTEDAKGARSSDLGKLTRISQMNTNSFCPRKVRIDAKAFLRENAAVAELHAGAIGAEGNEEEEPDDGESAAAGLRTTLE